MPHVTNNINVNPKTEEINQEFQKAEYQPLRELGFNRKNITSIAGNTCNINKFKAAANVLIQKLDLVKDLTSDLGFSVSNISGILNKSRGKIAQTLTHLHDNRSTLQNVMKNTSFSPQQVSTFLHGSGKNIKDSVMALNKNQKSLIDLSNSGLGLKSVSLLLHHSANQLDKSVSVLQKNLPVVQQLLNKAVNVKKINPIIRGNPENAKEALSALNINTKPSPKVTLDFASIFTQDKPIPVTFSRPLSEVLAKTVENDQKVAAKRKDDSSLVLNASHSKRPRLDSDNLTPLSMNTEANDLLVENSDFLLELFPQGGGNCNEGNSLKRPRLDSDDLTPLPMKAEVSEVLVENSDFLLELFPQNEDNFNRGNSPAENDQKPAFNHYNIQDQW